MEAHCSSRHSDKNVNALSRLQITMATAINKNRRLPNYIVILLENNLIVFLGYRNMKVATMYLVRMVDEAN